MKERIAWYWLLLAFFALSFFLEANGGETSKGCYDALGIQTGEIDDEDVTVSSKQKNFTSTDAWCPSQNDENQYMQVDLSVKTKLTRIATQGQIGGKDRHVKQYALFYSDDGKKWNAYDKEGKEELFDGNVDSFSVHHNNLKTPLVTRYIRVNPRKWENAICLRMELYGCDAE